MKKSQLKKLIKEIVCEIREEKKTLNESSGHPIPFNGRFVDPSTIKIGDVDPRDYPDFSDSFVEAASYVDGTPLSEDECQRFGEENGELVNDIAHEHYLQ